MNRWIVFALCPVEAWHSWAMTLPTGLTKLRDEMSLPFLHSLTLPSSQNILNDFQEDRWRHHYLSQELVCKCSHRIKFLVLQLVKVRVQAGQMGKANGSHPIRRNWTMHFQYPSQYCMPINTRKAPSMRTPVCALGLICHKWLQAEHKSPSYKSSNALEHGLQLHHAELSDT